TQDVDAYHAQRALGAGDGDVELEHGANEAQLRQLGDARVERLGKAGAAAAYLDVGFTGHRAHRGGRVLDRGAVDEMHRVAERDAEGDASHRERQAAARTVRVEQREKSQHRPDYSRREPTSSPAELHAVD